jgi:hypothetical protein
MPDLVIPRTRPPVTSVFGRQGAVVAASGDYTASQITFTPSGFVSDTDTQAALATIISTISALNTSLADFKGSVRVATTANITLTSAPSSIDGVTLSSGNRVLVKDQSTGSQNGIYVFNGAGSAMTRATDADGSSEVTAGMVVVSTEGTVNADKLWELTTNDPITLGTTSLTFAQVSGSGGLTMEEIEDNLAAGVIVSGYNTLIEYDDAANTFTWHESLRICSDADASTITFDLSDDHTDANAGSWHATEEITANRTLAITNAGIGENNAPGKRFQIQLNYDDVGGHVVTWFPNINWVNRYPPALTPVGGGSDTFEFLVTSIDVYGVPTLEGWILSTERGVMATGSAGEFGISALPSASWSLNEASGSRADDVGSLDLSDQNTVASTTGLIGNAALFVKSNDECLYRDSDADITGGNRSFSLSLWMKSSGTGGGGEITLATKSSWTVREYTIRSMGSSAWYFEVGYSGTDSVTAGGVISLEDGEWHHLVGVFDQPDNEVRLYVDGELFATGDFSGHTAVSDSGTKFILGGLRQTSSNFGTYDGALDQVDFFEAALTSADVAYLWNAHAGQTYPQNEGSGLAEIDWSICEGETITLTESGVHQINHINPIPLKSLLVAVTSDAATGTMAWGGVTVEWGTDGPPDVPADGDTIYLKFECVSTSLILGKLWHA